MVKNTLKGLFKSKKKKQKQEEIQVEEPQMTQEEQLLATAMASGDDDDEDYQQYVSADAGGGRNKKTISSALELEADNVAEQINQLASPDDLENVEFSMSVPSGADFEQVNRYSFMVAENARRSRQVIDMLLRDREKLMTEAVKLDAQMLEQKQQNFMGQQLAGSQSKADRLNEDLIKIREQLNREQSENIRLKKQLANGLPNPDNSLAEQNRALQEQNLQLQRQIEETNKQVNSIQEQNNQEVAQELERLRQEKANLENQVQSLSSQSENSVPADEVTTLRQQLEQREQELASLQASPNEYEQENANLRAKLAQVMDIRASADADLSLHDEKINALQTEVDKYKRMASELADKQAQAPVEVDNSEAQQRIAELEAEVKKARREAQQKPFDPEKPETFADTAQDDYEASVISRLAKKNKSHPRRQKKRLSAEDIAKMQAEENAVTYPMETESTSTPGTSEPVHSEPEPAPVAQASTASDPFADMMKEMNDD